MIHPKPEQPLPEPLADLQNDFPGWSIWTSNGDGGWTSRCYATRLDEITDDQVNFGLARTLQAPTPDKLRDLLAAQANLAKDLTERRSRAW